MPTGSENIAISTEWMGLVKRAATSRKARINDQSVIDNISQDAVDQITRLILLLIAVVLVTAVFGMCVHAHIICDFTI